MEFSRGESRGIEYSGLDSEAHVAIELQEINLLNQGANLLRRVSAVKQQEIAEIHRITTSHSTKRWKMMLGIGGLSVAGVITGGVLSTLHYLNHSPTKSPQYGLTPSIYPTMRALTTMPVTPHPKPHVEHPHQNTPGTFEPEMLATSREHIVCHYQIEVESGGHMTVTDANFALFTQNLFRHSALAVLSNWNGQYYERRTLMHFAGHALRDGLTNGADAEGIITELQHEINQDGGKVIWVWGEGYQDPEGSTELGLLFGQHNEAGESPILNLIRTPSVSRVLTSAIGITVYPNGTFQLQGNAIDVRPCSDWEECMYAFEQ